jgi:hypothetical protein
MPRSAWTGYGSPLRVQPQERRGTGNGSGSGSNKRPGMETSNEI